MPVNVSATFSKETKDLDGLDAIKDDLCRSPLTRRVVVAIVETHAIRVDVHAGMTKTPTVRFVHIEALDDDAANVATGLLDEAFKMRTDGRDPTELRKLAADTGEQMSLPFSDQDDTDTDPDDVDDEPEPAPAKATRRRKS